MIRVIAIDDEPLAVRLLVSYVEKTPDLELLGSFTDSIRTINAVKEQKPDLLLLDIQMPELSGMEFARLLPAETRIVFTTAFKQYAIDGYKVSAFDYLLKPISYETFLATAEKAMQSFNTQQQKKTTTEDRYIFVKSDYRLVKIKLDDILYIEGVKDYVRMKLTDGNRIMSLINMKRLEELLPRPEFMRTHCSYIVHMTQVQTVDKQRLMFGDEAIPISDNYKEDVMRFVEAHTLA
jgi:DNA-binding LytR/AlgR family response regulator